MEKKYVVIWRGHDGDVGVSVYAHSALVKAMTRDSNGDREMNPEDVLKEWPKDSDPGYWGDGEKFMIIEGKMVVPIPATIIDSVELP